MKKFLQKLSILLCLPLLSGLLMSAPKVAAQDSQDNLTNSPEVFALETSPATTATIYVKADSASETRGDGSLEAPFTSLAAAFSAANSDTSLKTVKLISDYELKEEITLLEPNIIFDLGDYTLSVNIPSADFGSPKNAFQLSGGKFTVQNGTVKTNSQFNRFIKAGADCQLSLDHIKIGNFKLRPFGNDHVSLKDIDDKGAVVEISNNTKGSLNISYCSLGGEIGSIYGGNGGAVYAENAGTVVIENSVFQKNYSTAGKNDGNNKNYGGGAIKISNAKVTIRDSQFYYNRTYAGSGGAVFLEKISDSQISYNIFDGNRVFLNHGGAILLREPQNVLIENNEITYNEARNNGGGLAIIANGQDNSCTLSGNLIGGNLAEERGGGIFIQSYNSSNVDLQSGRILKNTAYWFGGGIDYTFHQQDPLHLNNVLITANKAVRGGGYWACPKSETNMYTTFGAAIYDNTAAGEIVRENDYSLAASGADIRHEAAKDSQDKWVNGGGAFAGDEAAAEQNPTAYIKVSPRALGGGRIDWQQYQGEDSNPSAVDPAIFSKADNSFGLTASLAPELQEHAQNQALIIIKGNVCGEKGKNGRGGGIATNSPVIFGQADSDVSVQVKSDWASEEPTEADTFPAEIKIDLYQLGEDGLSTKLDSNISLSNANQWSSLFTNLPGKILNAEGQEQEASYTVKAQAVPGWTISAKGTYDADSRTWSIELSRSLNPEPEETSTEASTETQPSTDTSAESTETSTEIQPSTDETKVNTEDTESSSTNTGTTTSVSSTSTNQEVSPSTSHTSNAGQKDSTVSTSSSAEQIPATGEKINVKISGWVLLLLGAVIMFLRRLRKIKQS